MFNLARDYQYEDYDVMDEQIVSGVLLTLKLVYQNKFTNE